MRFLVYSNLFIAASAALFTHETYLLLEVEPRSSPLLFLVFSATLLVYNLDRVSDTSTEDAVDASVRHEWIERRSTLLWGLSVAAALGIAASLLLLPLRILLATLPLGAIALGYSLPVISGADGRRRLKDIAGLKIVLIVAVWTGATVLLPALETLENPASADVALLAAERALFILAITLPFDVRDLERDRAAEIRTIPMLVGVERTRNIAVAAIGLFTAVVLWHHTAGSHPANITEAATGAPTVPLVLSAAVTAVVLSGADRVRDEMYYVGQLDGMIGLQWLLVAGWELLGG